MVTDRQARRLMKLIQKEKTLSAAAAKAGMDEKTARKWRDLGNLPSEVKREHTWRTRPDPFIEVWEEVRAKLEINPGLEAKTLFEELQRRFSGRFPDGQLRTLQRRVKIWRALEGPGKEVFFSQVHEPGKLCQSDFTRMGTLGITIQGKVFPHLLYHFVLPYSNWETGTICFSESFEALSEGVQNALWELGGVPREHRTDRMSTAVQKPEHPEMFTTRYQGLLNHYRLDGRRIQTGKANENGDVEQRHHRFKRAVEQALMLRGSSDFVSRDEYTDFLKKLFDQLNLGRRDRLDEELKVLGRLPVQRLDACKRLMVRVRAGSTIRVNNNVYSVNSRLIGEKVNVRLYAEHLEVWYAQRCVETIPRLMGKKKHRIEYRHVIDWLVRKPGAFENYRYREELFPTHRFRMAYDELRTRDESRASRQYLEILHLAARESETGVDDTLGYLLDNEKPISPNAVEVLLRSALEPKTVFVLRIDQVDLARYDTLLENQEVCA